jgi:predicted DNA-binding transcriptional regulator AlpA
MEKRINVGTTLEVWIKRVTSGKGTPEEIAILPEVLKIYAQDYAERIDIIRPGSIIRFPSRGSCQFIDGQTAANFLGFKDNKRPEKAIKRLSDEGKLPQPVRHGDKTLRWNSDDIWKYRDEVIADAQRRANTKGI